MNLEKITGNTKEWLNRRKPHFDKITDPIYFRIASNAGLIFGAHKAIEEYGENPAEMAGLSAAAGVSLLLLNRYLISPIARGIRIHHQRNINRKRSATRSSWYRTIMQYLIPAGFIGVLHYADDIDYIKRRAESYFTDKYKPKITAPVPAKDFEDSLLKKKVEEILIEELENTRRETDDGRFYRTFRWEKLFRDAETKYGIKENLLAGTAMHESYGDPFTIGPTNDAGLMQIIPSTGRRLCGMKIYENPTSYRMRELVRIHNGNLDELAKIDERFDPAKSIECAAKHLEKDYRRYFDWDKAVSAYNRGVPARNLKRHPYVANVKKSRDMYIRKRGELFARAASGNEIGQESASKN